MQQPNTNRTPTGWRSGGSSLWMSHHTGGSQQDTHGTPCLYGGRPWVAQYTQNVTTAFFGPPLLFLVHRRLFLGRDGGVHSRFFFGRWSPPLFLWSTASFFLSSSSIKGAIIVRGGVDNDTTLHDAHCTCIHSCLQSTCPDQV